MSPTRELAVQIFQVLQKAGKFHTFSVGLLIGGKKDFYDEQNRIGSTNLIIATPGRLLQHCEQTPYLELGSVKILVLDECDRILDMGFRHQLVRILEYLPNEKRQTLLFSATQTRDVSQLATLLSLKKPEYLGVHDKEKNTTPEGLQQSYVVVDLKDKLNAVFSFLKSNLKSKTILFFASCAQVRHANQLFCALRPGISVLCLHGKLPQTKRTQIYFDFLSRPHAVLIATDICARGLDFPNVDWVVQVDAPEDKDMYIHRAGRTARYRAGGKALLFLTPAEEKGGFLKILTQGSRKKKMEGQEETEYSPAAIPLKKVNINPNKTVVVGQRAASLVASDVELNRLAKKAFQSYVRSIHFMPHKEVFDATALDVDGYATSLGLAATPALQFLKTTAGDRDANRKSKNVNRKLQKLKEQIKAEKLAKKIAKLGGKAGKNALQDSQEDNHDDDVLLVSKKSQSTYDSAEETPDVDPGLSEAAKSRHPKKIRVEGSNTDQNTRILFSDDGEEQNVKEMMLTPADPQKLVEQNQKELAKATDEYMEKVLQRLQATSELDKEEAKQRIREKHRKRRLQERGEKREDEGEEPVAMLADPEESDDNEEHIAGESESASSAEASSSSDSSDEDSSVDTAVDTKEQEDMALALIRGSE